MLVALLCAASAVGADSGADLAQVKRALAAIQGDVRPAEVNRLDRERRYAIWEVYYSLLEQLGRMQVHHEMMARHGRQRQAEFDAAHAEFARSLETLRGLLHAGD